MKNFYPFVATAGVLLGLYLAFLVLITVKQRQLLYFPTHDRLPTPLRLWNIEGRMVGYCRETEHPKSIWLMLHGNGGQASHREYVLNCLRPEDSLYIVEYPGYGEREGRYSRESINAAATEAYAYLRRQYPGIPVCVLGESLGSGPASCLASSTIPPDKIVLVVPFDSLSGVAQEHFPLIPAGLLLWDNWDNVQSLKDYQGTLEIYGAVQDTVIPIRHAKNLAVKLPRARLYEIPGGHNDWATGGYVKLRN